MWAYTEDEMNFFAEGAQPSHHNPIKKETNMNDFNMLNMIEEYRKNARLALNVVPHKDLKSLLEKAIDLQVDTAKFGYDLVNDKVKALTPTGK